MASKFGGVPVDDVTPSGSKFGGVAIEEKPSFRQQRLEKTMEYARGAELPFLGLAESVPYKPLQEAAAKRVQEIRQKPEIPTAKYLPSRRQIGSMATETALAAAPIGEVYGATKGLSLLPRLLTRGAAGAGTAGAQAALTEPVSQPSKIAEEKVRSSILPAIVGGAFPLGGELIGAFRTPTQRAAKITAEALGEKLPEARQILKDASDELTASQTLGKLDSEGKPILTIPTAQALLKRAEERKPGIFAEIFGKQEAKRFKELQDIAGGANATAAREATDQLKRDLNDRLIPKLKIELEAANIAGQKLPKYESEARRYGEAAKAKVEDVRRFEASKDRAKALARSDLIRKGQPVGAEKYTYIGGDLPRLAERVSADAAKGSLSFGEARRFREAAAQSLAAHGLQPLEAAPIINALNRKLSDPSIAGNRNLEKALTQVGEDIEKWTNNKGIIDAWALENIRKNSVNAVAQDLFKQDTKAQKIFAGQVLSSVRPVIVDAIEEAGGTGYRKYLEDYARGSQLITQSKFGREMMDLYKTSPKEFVRFVEGESPEQLEKIFGPGSYNIFKEISLNTQRRLTNIANELKRDEAIKEQAQAGYGELSKILKTNLGLARLPAFFSPKATIGNTLISNLEDYVNKETLQALNNAAKSGKNLEQLLAELPNTQREELQKALSATAVTGATTAPRR